eukprot:gb/GFBE01080856.1/.p1 GENE.gb/GFBE01080856.1/~~gb/GFBE01080856.1/.p1  ORF type:complete len:604 (+),score=167.97 gb/GFBE01080856.1/:1-1812(+)
MPVLTVCQGASCGGNGATFAIRDIEDLSYGLGNIEVTGCLGHCQKGPNCSVSETSGGKGKVFNKLNKLSKITEMLEGAIAGFALSDVQKKVAKLKFNARRDESADERKKLIGDALALLTDDVKALNPELYGQTLCLRARENLKVDPKSAYGDMKQVMALMPDWAFGNVTMSQACEAVGMSHGALAAMQKAMKIGYGVDKNTLKRALTRLERRAAESEPDVEPEGCGDAAAPAADGVAPAEPKAKPKSKAKAKSKTTKTDQTKKSSSSSSKTKEKEKAPAKEAAPVAPPEPEVEPEEQEWQLKSVRNDNHDCIRMELACTGKPHKSFSEPIWHVDLIAEMGDMNEEVKRSYTPASSIADLQKGTLDLMVKVYPQGKMTQYLSKMKVGDNIIVTKPIKTEDPADYKEGLVMVAGGSAVTVALQVCEAVLAICTGEVHLFLCNRTAEDVLFIDRLEALLEANSKFKVTHCLSQGKAAEEAAAQKATWQSGRLTAENLASVPRNTKAVLSGPGPLMRMAYDALCKLDRTEDMIHCLDPLPEAVPEPEVPAPALPAPVEEKVAPPPPKHEEAGGFFASFFLFRACSTRCADQSARRDDEIKDDVVSQA